MVLRRKWTIVILIFGYLLLGGCDSTGIRPGNNTNETIPLISGYTCCNLRHEGGGDWISELNYIHWKMIPLGTPATVTQYGRNRAHLDMEGKPMRLGQDYSRNALSLEEYVRRMIVPEDPRIKLATYPPDIQEAIALGKLMLGMSKEQVIMSVGYPLPDENPDMNAKLWRMWTDSFSEYQLIWDNNDRIKEIVGDTMLKNVILYK